MYRPSRVAALQTSTYITHVGPCGQLIVYRRPAQGRSIRSFDSTRKSSSLVVRSRCVILRDYRPQKIRPHVVHVLDLRFEREKVYNLNSKFLCVRVHCNYKIVVDLRNLLLPVHLIIRLRSINVSKFRLTNNAS